MEALLDVVGVDVIGSEVKVDAQLRDALPLLDRVLTWFMTHSIETMAFVLLLVAIVVFGRRRRS